MLLNIKTDQRRHLELLRHRGSEDVVELCKAAFEYLSLGPNTQRYQHLAEKYCTDTGVVQKAVEALIALLISATKGNASESDLQSLQQEEGYSNDVMQVLSQFVSSKRHFIEGSIKSANIRAYRLVNIEWRLEVRLATRSLLRQSSIRVTMKLYLHTEPKNENRDLLEDGDQAIHSDERRNRKDLLVQTDLSSLVHMIQVLETALYESKSRRIRNIVSGIH
ncbi:PREDICTED: COMM domain-containing protein 2 [Bactrocera latifrons]|uniref:COMM domain-containing protein 2 n=1 Tax=Bactrocera latifrons TaxID=174628 RepID=A0A0K8WDC6_BACLA|nr:PREDICTED: COMM domain-containing protein 2 [Bactrocera latifrons]